MITKELKAMAMGQIKMHVPLNEIAVNLDIPLPLIQEWYTQYKGTGRSEGDLTQVAANIYALNKLSNSEVIASSENTTQILQVKCETVALDIVDQISLCIVTDDLVRARTLQICADAVTKLYNSMISKSVAPDGSMKPSTKSVTIFQQMMSD